MRVFKIIGNAAVAFYDELFFYILYGFVNLLAWAPAAIPVIGTLARLQPFNIFYLLSWLLVIPGLFALAGLYHIGQQTVRGKGVTWQGIWEAVKEFGPRTLLLFLIVSGVYVIIGLNLWFYSNPDISPFPASVAVWTTPVFAVLAIVWTGVVFYAQAFLVELVEPKMRLVLRNSLFLALVQPFQTLTLLIVSVLTLALSIALPLLLIVWPGFISCLTITAVRQLVAHLTVVSETMEQDTEADATEVEDDSDDGASKEPGNDNG